MGWQKALVSSGAAQQGTPCAPSCSCPTAWKTTLAIPADMALDLGNSYEYAQARAEDRQRLLAEKGMVSIKNPVGLHEVLIDDTISEAVFSLDWYETYFAYLEFELYDPNGNIYDH